MLKGMKKKKLTIIKSNDGSVMHALKKNEYEFIGFGEAYFSTVNYNSIKAWKLHTKMTLNLIVPSGEVLFYFLDNRKDSSSYNKFEKITLSEKNYFRLTVPPNIWFGFKGISRNVSIILNIADMIHDPDEVLRKNLDEIDVAWTIKNKDNITGHIN